MTNGTENSFSLALQPVLKAKSDLCGKTLLGLSLHGTKANQSLFNGSLLSKSRFDNVDFSRSDFEGTRVENCDFNGCSFENCDIKSTCFIGSSFRKCTFALALIEDCTFASSTIEECQFESTVVQESDFQSCVLKENQLRKSSWMLDSFRKTAFKAMGLGDCTFLGHLFHDCTFEKVSFNAESIGTCYGLSENDIRRFDWLFLGQESGVQSESFDPVKALEGEYKKRKWDYELSIFQFNLEKTDPLSALFQVFDASFSPIKKGLPLKKNQVRFLEKLLLELHENGSLPPLVPLRLTSKLDSLSQKGHSSLGRSQQRALQQINYQIREIAAKIMDEGLSLGLLEDLDRDDKTTVDLKFHSRPKTDVIKVLDAISLRQRITKKAGLLAERTGSHIITVEVVASSLAGLRLIIWLATGVVVQMNKLKISTMELIGIHTQTTKRKSPASFQLALPQKSSRRLASMIDRPFAKVIKEFIQTEVRSSNFQSIKETSSRIPPPSKKGGSKRRLKAA